MFDLSGMRVLQNPLLDEPNMKLSDDVPVTAEFRKEYDAWLLKFFGRKPPVFYVVNAGYLANGFGGFHQGETMIVSSGGGFQQLKNALEIP